MAFNGIDLIATGDRIIVRTSLLDSVGAKVVDGDTDLYIYELQADASLKALDFDDNTFKTGALTVETAAMAHQTANAGNTNTGIWTALLTDLDEFIDGGIYLFAAYNVGASPPWQYRQVQYGGAVPARLTPDGLDYISITAPTGPAETFREMWVQLWRRLFKRARKDKIAKTITTFADNGSTVITTQAYTDTDAEETQGPAT